jgi:hypothetical protein
MPPFCYNDYRVTDIEYLFDVRIDEKRDRIPGHLGLQSVAVYVLSVGNITCSLPIPDEIKRML